MYIEPLLINHPLPITIFIVIISLIIMISGILNAKLIDSDKEYKNKHNREYTFSILSSIIGGLCLLFFILIMGWSFIVKNNVTITYGLQNPKMSAFIQN
jgi:hypothetical protein